MNATITDVEAGYIVGISLALSITSAVSCCAAIATYFFCRRYFSSCINRVSLRLSVAISIADLFYSAIQIWSNYSSPNEPLCSLSVAAYIGFTVLPLFLYFSMAMNLILVFCYNYRGAVERWYYMCSVSMTLVIVIVGILSGQLGWDEPLKTCWYKYEGTKESILWQSGMLYVWTAIISIFCLWTVTIVIRKLRTEKTLVERLQSNKALSATQLAKRKIELNRLVHRIVLYPLIPAITQSSTVVLGFYYYYTQSAPFWAVFIPFATNSIQGLLNSIALFLDPAIIRCLGQTRTLLHGNKKFTNHTRKLLCLLCCVAINEREDANEEAGEVFVEAVTKGRASSLPVIEIVGAIPMEALSSPRLRAITINECSRSDLTNEVNGRYWQSSETIGAKSNQSLWSFL